MWMSRPGWVVHKRAFVTLGHNSLPSACSGVGHKGIVRTSWKNDARAYGYVRTSRPSLRAGGQATRKPNASSCWLPAWRFLTSIRMSASPEPPVPTAGGAGTLWTPIWPRATPSNQDDIFAFQLRGQNRWTTTNRWVNDSGNQHPALLILDDLGLHRFTAQQTVGIYGLILNRQRTSSFVITSDRAVDEWMGLFEDPILGNSALDRLANASYQTIIEGGSYRERLSPQRARLGAGK